MYRLLNDYITRKNWSLVSSGKMISKPSVVPTDLAVGVQLYQTVTAFTYELLVLITENFKKNGLNFGDPSIRNMMADIKKNLPEEMRTMNSTEFLKALRDSIVHNSNEIRNFDATDINSFRVNLRKKGVRDPHEYAFSADDLLVILEIYDNNRVLTIPHGSIDIADDYNSLEGLLKAKKKFGSFNSVITFTTQDGVIVPMDSFQENALLRFLINYRKEVNKFKDFPLFLQRFFPNQDNKLNLYEQKYHLSMALCTMFDNLFTQTNEDTIKLMKKVDPIGAMPFLDTKIMKSILYSSMAFSIFSSRTPENLLDLATTSEISTDADTLRHIRNSLVHGRYFFNFKNGFEIYDGKDNNLEHYTTLTYDVIEAMFKTIFTQEQAPHLAKNSIKTVNDLILHNSLNFDSTSEAH